MKIEDKKEFAAMLSQAGEQTRALVLIEYTHEGRCTMKINGPIDAVAFCSKSLDLYLNETMSGRQSNESQRRG